MKTNWAMDDSHSLNETEVKCFLETPTTLPLAKNDEMDDPNIQPIDLNM